MPELTDKTHHDYAEVIGNTVLTAKGFREKGWNRYYHAAHTSAVRFFLRDVEDRSVVLDVGCSHGSWYPTWRKLGFTTVHGVELSPERAAQARHSGFDHVYVTDARSIQADSESYSVVCSSGVFIHILQLKDKLAVVEEVYRLLEPGGVFILNFPPPLGHGYTQDTILNHCSFYSLDTMLQKVILPTSFELVDIRQTFFPPYSRFREVLGWGMALPFTISLMRLHDLLVARKGPYQLSGTIYLKLRKPALEAK